MIKETRSYSAPLTPELAEEFATMTATTFERPIDMDRVIFLRNRFDLGLFYSPEWAYAILGGKRFRVNGQHSSAMLCQLNGSFPRGKMAHIREFQCDNEQDLADLFAQFDNKNSVRSFKDIVNAQASVHRELDDVSRTILTFCLRGIGYAMIQLGHRRPDEEAKARLLTTETPFVTWASNVLPRVNSPMNRSAVVGAIYLTWKKNPSDALQFWTSVASEANPDATHPTRVLARYLRDEIRRKDKSKIPADKVVFIRCVHAWNAFRKGGKTGLKVYSGNTPEIE